ncbi:MAG TPA: ATP-binding protein [Candidatus Acidoferrales bacterium]|nr:ATP-binding protein [Candidatus Acidoferrales bacterium]
MIAPPPVSLEEAVSVIAVLATLVGMSLSVQRQVGSQRVLYWAYAWVLTFLHFVFRILESYSGHLLKFTMAADYSVLELSALVFIASFLFRDDDRSKRLSLVALLGVPLVVHSFATYCVDGDIWLRAALFALVFLGAAAFCYFATARRTRAQLACIYSLGAIGILGSWRHLHGDSNSSFGIILTLAYGLCAVFFWKLYRRRSLGVIAVTAGFVGWAALFPITAFLFFHGSGYAIVQVSGNVPRLFVAMGMILTLFEDRSMIVEEARARAQAESLLLQRLSQITSRLLTGVDPIALCGEVAAAITEASGFRRAAVFLIGEGRKLYLAGLNGFTPQEARELEEHWGRYALELLKEFCERAAKGENSSCRLSEGEDQILIPLISRRESQVGCLYLSGSKVPGGVAASEVTKLEGFASELAVMIENIRLHRHLLRSEKLAALGQLVAGVAHELNNPLTGIIGYADLLSGEVREEGAAKRIEKLMNEARRMQRIVDGLLRFGRHSDSAARSANLEVALRDVIQLREYHLRAKGIRVDMQVEPMLLPVGIAEDALKQVLLNILNNAIDAVDESAQRVIRIRASSRFGRVTIQFDDSGPGFTDLHRAFEPFFTTKPVGKGTGLGLSICYGIVREHGGEITLANIQPYGASVVIELPVVATQPDAASAPESGQDDVLSKFVPGL